MFFFGQPHLFPRTHQLLLNWIGQDFMDHAILRRMDNQPIKAIIFDMDGTMVDNMAIHNQTWLDYLAEAGAQPDPRTFNDRTAGKTTPEIIRLYLGQHLGEAAIRDHSAEKELRYRRRFRLGAKSIPGLKELLHAARSRGIKLGVATSAPPENVRIVLESLDLVDFFDAVVNGEEIEKGKPDPEIFLTAAERLQTPPARCLVFEDSRLGVEAALRARMRVILITTGIPAEQALEISGVSKVIADFHQVSVAEILDLSEALGS